MRAVSVMDRKRSSAVRACPMLPLILQESIHSVFPDHPEILKRGFSVRILRCITSLLFHHIPTRIIRAFVAVFVSVFSPLTAKNDSAVPGTEFRFVVIRSVAPRTRIFFDQRLIAYIAIQSAWSNHLCFEHVYFPPLNRAPIRKASSRSSGNCFSRTSFLCSSLKPAILYLL